MKFEVNIRKKHMFLIVGVMIILAGAIAFGGSEPSVVGHSSGELEVSSLDAADGSPTKVLWVDNDGNIGVGGVVPDGEYELDVIAFEGTRSGIRAGGSATGVGIVASGGLMGVSAGGPIGIRAQTNGQGPNLAGEFIGDVSVDGKLVADSGWVTYSSGSIITTCQDAGYGHPTGMCKDFSGTIGPISGSETDPSCLVRTGFTGIDAVSAVEIFCA